MLVTELIRIRESLNLSKFNLCKITGVSFDEYDMLENPVSHKMSIPTYEKLNTVMNFPEDFKENYVTPYLKFGEVLKQKRLEKGLTLGELSRISHIKKSYLWSLENEDKRRMSYALFKRLEMALQIEDSENFEPFLVKTSTAKIQFVNDGLFGRLIMQKREEKSLSQGKLAIAAQIDRSLICKLEMGARKTLTTKTAIKLMDALDFTEEERGRYLIKR